VTDLDHVALVVEVQQGFDDAESWGRRNNPECESNIAELIAAWRDGARPVVFVRQV
jgi:nicotinamidase-related amidase